MERIITRALEGDPKKLIKDPHHKEEARWAARLTLYREELRAGIPPEIALLNTKGISEQDGEILIAIIKAAQAVVTEEQDL